MRRLQAHDDGVLPAEAWAAFPGATGLVINTGFCSIANGPVLGARLLALLPGLPERVEGITVRGHGDAHQEACDAFLMQLLSGPLARRLLQLEATNVPAETARRLLAGLPRLQRCELYLRSPGRQADPDVVLSQFPVQLQQLDLGGMEYVRSCSID